MSSASRHGTPRPLFSDNSPRKEGYTSLLGPRREKMLRRLGMRLDERYRVPPLPRGDNAPLKGPGSPRRRAACITILSGLAQFTPHCSRAVHRSISRFDFTHEDSRTTTQDDCHGEIKQPTYTIRLSDTLAQEEATRTPHQAYVRPVTNKGPPTTHTLDTHNATNPAP